MERECPYCEDFTGTCDHVLLDYDATFMEFLGGYLADNQEAIEELKSEMLELIKSSEINIKKPGLIKDIWDYAFENYVRGSDEIDFDLTAYFNLLDEHIDSFGGESYHYEDEDGAPGFSSAYVIYYAKDPEGTIQQFNSYILGKFKGR